MKNYACFALRGRRHVASQVSAALLPPVLAGCHHMVNALIVCVGAGSMQRHM